jgi:hypothetical protein
VTALRYAAVSKVERGEEHIHDVFLPIAERIPELVPAVKCKPLGNHGDNTGLA